MKTITKPKRIHQQQIADMATAGVERATQARELNAQEIAEVSGGASLSLQLVPIIAGGIRATLANNLANPMVNPAAFDTGFTGMV